MTESKPADKLKMGLLAILGSVPLAFIPVVRIFAAILFLAGLILYSDGLVQNQKWEKAKKQAAVAAESTKR